MKYFHRIASGIEIAPIIAELDAQPQLWDQIGMRTKPAGSPHAEASDIWLRFRDPSELKNLWDYTGPHVPVFYPAWSLLPSLHPVVYALMAHVRAVQLGGILVTRIPAGRRILPHHDRGSWHAEFFNTKVYIPIRANPECVNHCEGESVVMREGDVWTFDNMNVHSVENNGSTERITVIVTMRVE